MPSSIYFDCFSGISGDMALGALLDAGLDLAALQAELAKLNVAGWTLHAEPATSGFLAGTRARVRTSEQHAHRHLTEIEAILAGSGLDARIQERARRVFRLLATAEGRVHGIPPEQVHFHEVGALDAIVDIVGVVTGLALLGVEQVYASGMPLGGGWVQAEHGMIPIPAPATLEILAAAGAPILPDETPAELVTPTGAALVCALAEFRRPAMRVQRIGYGLGTREIGRPNAVRVWLGERDALDDAAPILLETNLDDITAAQLAYVAEQLLALGALDVWQVPIQMKKGRAALLLCALVPPALETGAVGLLMRETTTLGVRRRVVERFVAERETLTAPTPWGPVRLKRKRWAGADMGAEPEYEDCARLAREAGVPLRLVYQAARGALTPG